MIKLKLSLCLTALLLTVACSNNKSQQEPLNIGGVACEFLLDDQREFLVTLFAVANGTEFDKTESFLAENLKTSPKEESEMEDNFKISGYYLGTKAKSEFIELFSEKTSLSGRQMTEVWKWLDKLIYHRVIYRDAKLSDAKLPKYKNPLPEGVLAVLQKDYDKWLKEEEAKRQVEEAKKQAELEQARQDSIASAKFFEENLYESPKNKGETGRISKNHPLVKFSKLTDAYIKREVEAGRLLTCSISESGDCVSYENSTIRIDRCFAGIFGDDGDDGCIDGFTTWCICKKDGVRLSQDDKFYDSKGNRLIVE